MYFQYFRSNNRMSMNVSSDNIINNKLVILYNLTLNKKYNCHINL